MLPNTLRRRSRRSVLGLCLAGVTTAVALLALAAVGLAVSGPIRLDFVREQIAGNLEKAFGPEHTVSVGAVHLTFGVDGVGAMLDGMTVRDARGRAVLASPAASLSFDGGALAAFRLAPRRLAIERLDLRLDVRADGGVIISTAPGGPPETGDAAHQGGANDAAAAVSSAAHPVAAALAELRQAFSDQGVFGRLARIDVTQGRLIVRHQPTGRETVFSNLALTQTGAGESRQIALTADAPHGAMSLRYERRSGADGAFDRVIARDLAVSDLGSLFGLAPVPTAADAPVSAQADIRLDEARNAVTVDGRISFGASRFSIDDTPSGEIAIDEAGASFLWDSATAVTRISDLHVLSGELRLAVSGQAEEDAHAPGVWAFSLAGRDGGLEPIQRGERATTLDSFSLAGSLDVPGRTLGFSKIAIAGPFGAAQASGRVSLTPNGPALEGRLEAARIPVRDALAIWPKVVATEVHQHLVKALTAGRLDSLAITADLTADDLRAALDKRGMRDAALRGDYAISGATFAAIEGVPPVAQMSFTGQLTGRASSIAFPRGVIDFAPNRRLTISDGAFTVADTAKSPADGRFSMRIQGAADAAADFLARPGVRGDGPVQLDPATVKGTIDVKVQVGFPLQAKLEKGDVLIQVSGQLANVTLEKAFGKERLEGLNAVVTNDRAGLAIKGEGRLLGAVAQIDYRKPATQDGEVQVQMVVDEAARARKGMSISGLKGPVLASIKTTPRAGGEQDEASVSLDLARATIEGLVPGWSKPAGKPGKITFVLAGGDAGARLSNLVMESGSLLVKGGVTLDAEGGVKSARLDQMRIIQGDSAKVDVDKVNGVYRAVVRGASLDVRALLKGQTADAKPTDLRPDAKGGEGKSGDARSADSVEKDIDLDLKVAVLGGFNNEALTNAEVRIVRKGADMKQFVLNGRLNGVRVTGRLNANGGGMLFQTGDAGGFLRFADIYGKMIGGDLTLAITSNPARQDGVLTVNDFLLRNEPAVSGVSAQSRTTSVNGEVDVTGATAANDVRFTKMRADFSREPTRITFKDAVMWGSEVGGTLSGALDFGRDKVSMTGTFVPAYAVNNLFSKVPLFGPLLGGGQNEGLFAVAFAINGKVSAPVVSVNPLSVIAPGFLRKIFEYRNESGGGVAPPQPEGAQ